MKVNFRFPVEALLPENGHEEQRGAGDCLVPYSTLALPRTPPVSTPELLAHGMDDQKRRTAVDHYANDTFSKSPENKMT